MDYEQLSVSFTIFKYMRAYSHDVPRLRSCRSSVQQSILVTWCTHSETPLPVCSCPECRGWVKVGRRPAEASYGPGPRRGDPDRPRSLPLHQPHLHWHPEPENIPAHLREWWLDRLSQDVVLWRSFTRRMCPSLRRNYVGVRRPSPVRPPIQDRIVVLAT